MKYTKKKIKAFSLIEISIVILIIGVLLVGVTQSSTLLKKANLSKAKSLTTNSEVKDIPNLAVWVETSLPESVELDSAGNVSSWNDINPQQDHKVNATQFSAGTAPAYVKESTNDLPAIKFNGAEYLLWDPSGNKLDMLVGNNYSAFIVEQRTADNSNNYIIAGSGTALYQNLTLGYTNSSTARHSHYSHGWSYAVPSFSDSQGSSRIHSFMFSATTFYPKSGGSYIGSSYFMNGGTIASGSHAPMDTAVTEFEGASIGNFSGNYYEGYVSEIIIFNRYLGEDERKTVEEYLGKKYGINVN